MTKAVAATASDGQRQETPRGEATRMRIRAEALALFYRQGFRATTMREITSAAGLTPAAFYNHYGSKDDVLLAIIVDAFTKLDEQVTAALAKAGDGATGRLAALVHTMTLWHCDNINQARVANRESQELDESMLGTVRERRRELRSMAEQIVTDGVEAGEFVLPDAPVEAAARVMATAMLGFVRSISAWYLEAKVLSPAELADLLVALVLRMVGAEAPAKPSA
ncbi:MAG TPA: TetR/AcrR family transcriptional regulator [Pseudonocardia sp.]|jgi:AcrR family transcriptional regulator|nr:TetR/AcrR family transcriptional regulator [Pseudonocardia sp.]